MRASRPTFARLAAAIPVGRAFAVGRRGGIYPARGRWRRRRGARDDASIVPYRGSNAADIAVSRVVVMVPAFCRAGVHARRTLVVSKLEHSRCRKVRRDEGIPPCVCPVGRGHPGWPDVGRGL